MARPSSTCRTRSDHRGVTSRTRVGQYAAMGSDESVGRRFEGRVAIVTGSTADPSIGRSSALRLAREGGSVVVHGRHAARVRATEAALRAEGLSVVGVTGSMDTEEAATALADAAVEAFGHIDLVVCTVGGAPHAVSFDTISEAQ